MMSVEWKTPEYIEALLEFGVRNRMMEKWDAPQVRNQLLALLKVEEPAAAAGGAGGTLSQAQVPTEILKVLLDEAVARGLIGDTLTERDILDAKIMAQLMPRQSELKAIFEKIRAEEGVKAATDYFYHISKASNYIRMDRIAKNDYWRTLTPYGDLEITINLSKPEKDPKEIQRAKEMPQSQYPKCLLCVENVGYEGHFNHPARSNHRILPVTLNQEQWYFQYSPYVYYNEHAIILKEEHEPMRITPASFRRLLDFVEQFPHYFIGSNADLPIVGGSILSHDHFQGGSHRFPMVDAKVLRSYSHPDYPGMTIDIVEWPLSVIRVASEHKGQLAAFAARVLEKWRGYSDTSAEIVAFTGETPHNTLTPIARVNHDGLFELDLVLRNNRTDEAHPDGIFHSHPSLHHIKKENIGLIEVMGLAVLPARLEQELGQIGAILTGEAAADLESLPEALVKHRAWIKDCVDAYGTANKREAAMALLKKEVGVKFGQVLACCGVYKLDEEGLGAFGRFVEGLVRER